MNDCVKSEVEEPVYIRLDSALDSLDNVIGRFGTALDVIEKGNMPMPDETTDKQEPTIMNIWRRAPSKIEGNVKEIQELIDRLEAIFR